MNPESDQPQPPADERGVFGNLPSARPGVRSPRRDGKRASEAKRAQSKGTKAKAPASARAKTPRPAAGRPRQPAPSKPRPASTEPPPSPAPPGSGPTESGRGGVEEVAWAGITVAAEAATLGVRLFSRAVEAVRERR